MTTANQPRYGAPLSDKEVLEKLAKNELGRFRKALFTSAKKLFEEKSNGMEAKDASRLFERTNEAAQVISIFLKDFVETYFEVSKKSDHDRMSWEEHFAGARSVARLSPGGYLMNSVARLLKLEETAGNVTSLVRRGNESLPEAHRVFGEIKKFVTNYEFAEKHAKSFGNESEGLAVKYAVLKTWEKQTDFDKFSSVAEAGVSDTIEIIIEGPFKLYMMISSEQFTIVLQLMTLLSSSEFEGGSDKGLGQALRDMKFSQKMLEGSPRVTIARELLSKALVEYHSLWKEECNEVRTEYLDDDRAKHFTECFEDGSLFIKR